MTRIAHRREAYGQRLDRNRWPKEVHAAGWPILRAVEWKAFVVAFPPSTSSPKKPVYAITPKLVSRPVEFRLPLCHATYGVFSNDAHNMSCRQQAEEVTKRDSPTGEEKANRNTSQFRNPYISFTEKDITFTNRNTKPVSANDGCHVSGLAQSDAAEGSPSTNHDSRFTNHG